eukprot:12398394-Karenia_brevis.AAC.1
MHVEIPLPSLPARQVLAAQDPLASTHHVHVVTHRAGPDFDKKFSIVGCANCRGPNHKVME